MMITKYVNEIKSSGVSALSKMRIGDWIIVSVTLALSLMVSYSFFHQPPIPKVMQEAAAKSADEVQIRVELANTPESRYIGLSKYDHIDPNQGMLFIFDHPGIQCMWAQDMKFDVSVGFMDDQHNLVNVEDMKAGDPKPHCSTQPVQLALEMSKGWFIKHQ